MYKVLIADDEPMICDGLKVLVDWNAYGFTVAGIAADGAQALQMILADCPDLLITDIRMPTMDGIELLKKIRELELDIKVIVLSGYDDFKYVRDMAVLGIENYLLKPVNEDEMTLTIAETAKKLEMLSAERLRSRLNSNAIRENILNRWVCGRIGDNELKDRAEFLRIHIDAAYYQPCLLKVFGSRGKGDAVLGQQIVDLCSELMGKNGEGYYIFQNYDGDVVVVFYGEESTALQTGKLLLFNRYVEKVRHLYHVEVFAFVGDAVPGYSLPESYRKILKQAKYSLVSPEAPASEKSSRAAAEQFDEKIMVHIRAVRKSVRERERELCSQNIDKLYGELRKMPQQVPFFFQSVSISLYSAMLEEIKGLETMKIQGEEIATAGYLSIFEGDSVEMLVSFMQKAAQDFIKTLEDRLASTSYRIVQYVSEHFHEELSLKTMAALYKSNAAYIGQIFKRDTGMAFSDYLNVVRIDHGKELLRGKRYSVKEIAEKVGFQNETYFFQVFKKIAGISPAEYRKLH